jgi:UDP-glucose 4-epimerase
LPNFVKAALDNTPINIFGNGQQSRCFCDVRDTVEALIRLMDTDRSVGEVTNVGNTEEITIENLAHMVKARTKSTSPIEYVPYDKAYEPGFEDMMRRVPSVEKLYALTGFRPETPLTEIIDRVTLSFQAKPERVAEFQPPMAKTARQGSELPS